MAGSATAVIGPRLAVRFDPMARRTVARAREAFFAGSPVDPARSGVSVEILSSWRRSRDLGVDPSRVAVPTHLPEPSGGRRLADAAWPVLQMLADQCRDSDAWAMLLDRDCVQVSRTVGDEKLVGTVEQRGGGVGATFREAMVGTNGAGISAERLESFIVVGEEHFREAEQGLATVGVPLRDPFGRLAGFLVMCQRVASANHMIVPYALNIARAIDDRLAQEVDGDERVLFDAFSRHSRRPSLPVIGLNDRVFVANRAAQQLLRADVGDESLRDTVLDATKDGRSRVVTVRVGDDRYRATCRVVELSRGRFGTVASLSRVDTTAEGGGHLARGSRPADPVDRAVALGLSVLVCGEPGSGRAHRVNSAIDAAPIDAKTAELDPGEWLARLTALAGAGPVLVRDVDALSSEMRARALEILRSTASWTAATAKTATPDLESGWDAVVDVPPLRDRVPEIPGLVSALLAELGAGSTRCAPEVVDVLVRHPWPGNLAQLRRVLAASLLRSTGGVIRLGDLPRQIADSGHRPVNEGLLARTEREMLFDALRDADWNRDLAAQKLGLSRATMYRRIRQFGFQLPSSR